MRLRIGHSLAIPPMFAFLKATPSDGWMQSVVAEMNLSETSFLVPAAETNSFYLRWFTPTTEVDLCGHATPATNDIDPVKATAALASLGLAHCCLAPYWVEQLGKTSLVGYQASKRGGTVYCEVVGNRVRLTGSAITVLEGRLVAVFA